MSIGKLKNSTEEAGQGYVLVTVFLDTGCLSLENQTDATFGRWERRLPEALRIAT